MNQGIKQRWIARLRSDKDKQGRGALRNSRDFKCCLGVLCEIAVEDGAIAPPTFGADYGLYHFGPSGETGVPPAEVVKWAGLSKANPDVMFGGSMVPITYANDQGATFATLADVIDAQL